MIQSRHILAIRFSALGDVAMTVPVIKNVLAQHPEIEITFVSTNFVRPLFENIDRLHFYGVDLKKYKGLPGLYRLSREIKRQHSFEMVADLHNVLRTKIIRFFLGKKNAAIDKGRAEKKQLTRPHNKIMRQLKTSFERYADVFRKLGIDVKLNVEAGLQHPAANDGLLPFLKGDYKVVGVAPFAKHAAKMYPIDKMKMVTGLLATDQKVKIILFTSKAELPLVADLLQPPNIYAAAGNFSFADELNIISKLDIMLSMDSANMHLASLYGVPVVSVWGGTHPFLGFYGWGQDENNILQTDLPCRPSSVFGNKECPVHGAAGCMQYITPQMVADKVEAVLAKKD